MSASGRVCAAQRLLSTIVTGPFAGNVPGFDLLAANIRGFAIPTQIKAIDGISWQLRPMTTLTSEIVDDVQRVRGTKTLVNPDLVYILVVLREDDAHDSYSLRLKDCKAALQVSIRAVAVHETQNPRIARYIPTRRKAGTDYKGPPN